MVSPHLAYGLGHAHHNHRRPSLPLRPRDYDQMDRSALGLTLTGVESMIARIRAFLASLFENQTTKEIERIRKLIEAHRTSLTEN